MSDASATEIVERIECGEWTASDVFAAYASRAAFAHAKTNCLTEGERLSMKVVLLLAHIHFGTWSVMIGAARQRAAELDVEFAATKKLRGPLHGVPVRSLLGILLL